MAHHNKVSALQQGTYSNRENQETALSRAHTSAKQHALSTNSQSIYGEHIILGQDMAEVYVELSALKMKLKGIFWKWTLAESFLKIHLWLFSLLCSQWRWKHNLLPLVIKSTTYKPTK